MPPREKLGSDFRERLRRMVDELGGVMEVYSLSGKTIMPSSLYSWMGIDEAGRKTKPKDPSAVKLVPLARTLGVTVDELLAGPQSNERVVTKSGQPIVRELSVRGIDGVLLAKVLSGAQGVKEWNRMAEDERIALVVRGYRYYKGGKGGMPTGESMERLRASEPR